MLFCFNNASTPIKPAGWFGLYGGKRVCEYQQPVATSSQGIHLNRKSIEVTHAAVSHLICMSVVRNAFFDSCNSFEQRPLSVRAAE